MFTDPDSMVYHLQDDDRPYFYLGSPEPSWLGRDEFCDEPRVPLFVSHRRLARLKTLPRARTSWALDSGGFTELSMYGDWTLHAVDYAKIVRRYYDQIGCMEWAAPQDWMCEPWILEKTGRTIQDHQLRTVANYADLRYEDDYLPSPVRGPRHVGGDPGGGRADAVRSCGRPAGRSRGRAPVGR